MARNRRGRPEGNRAPWEDNFDEALSGERVLIGSPSTIREYVERYVSDSTCNYLVTAFQWGDLTHQEASYSMELFASEVMPLFAEPATQPATV